MFNCSNCDSSKKLVDTKNTTARHHSSKCQKIDNWSKIICRTCILSSFTFRQKINDCLNCNWLTKVLKNINCSTQFIVKKMVCMYGSQIRCQVRLGVHVRQLGCVLGQVSLGQVYMYGSQVRFGQFGLGQVRLVQERLG